MRSLSVVSEDSVDETPDFETEQLPEVSDHRPDIAVPVEDTLDGTQAAIVPVGDLADLPQQAPPATPSTMARWLAFLSILIGGACGGMIGWGFVDLQCDDCSTGVALGGLLGAVLGAGGLAIVAVLGLRAMGEWQSVQDAEAAHKHPSRRRNDDT